jgi:hypothetical protein
MIVVGMKAIGLVSFEICIQLLFVNCNVILSCMMAGILGVNVFIGQILGAGHGYQHAVFPIFLSLIMLTLAMTGILFPRLKVKVEAGRRESEARNEGAKEDRFG